MDVPVLPSFGNIEDYEKTFRAAVVTASKAAGNLPDIEDDYSDPSYDIYRDMMNITGRRLLNLMERVFHNLGIDSKFSSDEDMDLDERFNILLDANMELFERIGTNIDEASGIKKNDVSLVVISRNLQQMTPGLNHSRNIAPKSGSKQPNFSLVTSKDIIKSQLKFRDKVDNSDQPFYPKIKTKSNALKSLEESMKVDLPFDYETNPSFTYPHPYQFELDSFVPESSFLQHVIFPKVPASLEETPLNMIEKPEQLSKLLEKLKTVPEFAVDLEYHSFRSFHGFTCLMQISTRTEDYIVDTLLLREELHQLNEVFTDPKIVKVFHGADMDVQWLQKDFGVYLVNLFDSGQAARLLRFPRFSLAYLLDHYCKVIADKSFQAADWRIRPLPEDFLKYARQDTHYLLYIYDCMKNDLLHRDNGQTTLLFSAFQNSSRICMKKYNMPRFTDSTHEELYYREINKSHDGNYSHRTPVAKFNNQQMEALKSLCAWRDRVARDEDESATYVWPFHMMLQVCQILPKEPQGIIALCSKVPPVVRIHLDEIHKLIQKARLKPIEVETIRKEIRPIALQHPKYRSKSLLPEHCPHDTSHQDTTQEETQNNTESSNMVYDSSLPAVESMDMSQLGEKEKPDLFFFGDNSKSLLIEQTRERKKRVSKVLASFADPFEMYLPADVLAKRYKDCQPFESTTKVLWKLLPNTAQLPSSTVIPTNQGLQVAQKTLELKNTEKSPEPVSLRTMANAERKRPYDESEPSPIRKKEKPAKPSNPTENTDFQPYDYLSKSLDEFLGNARAAVEASSNSSKKKDFDPNAQFAKGGFKAASRPRVHNQHSNKSLTYRPQARIQWPKK